MRALIFSFLLLNTAEGLADEYSQNVRELCRSEVGAALINSKNTIDMLHQNSEVWEQKISHLQLELKNLAKKLKPLRAKAKKEEFDHGVEEAIDAVRYKVRVVESQISLGESTLEKNYPELKKAEARHKNLLKDVKRVFKIKHVKTTHAGAYSMTVDFIFPCDRYQYICPLPERSRADLKRIKKYLASPEYCQRYASVINPNE